MGIETVHTDVDVLLVGGGTAGAIAGLQAAKAGARALILERSSQLGGTVTTGGVCMPGLFHAHGCQVIAGSAGTWSFRRWNWRVARFPTLRNRWAASTGATRCPSTASFRPPWRRRHALRLASSWPTLPCACRLPAWLWVGRPAQPPLWQCVWAHRHWRCPWMRLCPPRALMGRSCRLSHSPLAHPNHCDYHRHIVNVSWWRGAVG